MTDLIWTIVSLALTIIVLSYLIGDNGLFRAVLSIFVGMTAAVTAIFLVYQILIPRVFLPLTKGPATEKLLVAVPLILGLLLFGKLSTRWHGLGSVSVAFIIGAGAAIALKGVISGTLFSQIEATIAPFSRSAAGTNPSEQYQLMSGAFILFGTVATLAYFQYTRFTKGTLAKLQSPVSKVTKKLGETFIALTLGAVFAGILISSFTTLIERLDFVIQFIMKYLGTA
ncbi:MAG TPA: hypothetical protein PKD55_02055 [Bellilinea sp.]|nr:hypothetical protein [Bellilinea sp.]